MATISFQGATKVFPDGTTAVEDLDLDIADGEFAVIVGPSGSGKSTALKMVAGLEGVTSGVVRIGERVVNDLQPRQRDVAMVFQSYALYPHMSVADNLAFALKMRGVRKLDRRREASAVARRLGIEDLLHRRPSQLSGGQRQRVALGRAIVRNPQAFLMDEPLSNLDAKLRVEMRAYLAELHEEMGTTTVYVTHDQTEALTMGDRVAVMQHGRLEQAASPQELYDRPANLFVAGFIGSPAMSVVRARLEPAVDEGGGSENGGGGGEHLGALALCLGSERLVLPAHLVSRRPGLTELVGSDVLLGIRPEAFALGDGEPPPGRVLHLAAVRTELLGSDVLVYCEVEDVAGAGAAPSGEGDAADGEPSAAEAGGAATAQELDAVESSGLPASVVATRHAAVGDIAAARISARLPSGTAIAVGERVPLVVDLDRIHLFDPDTYEALPLEPSRLEPRPVKVNRADTSSTRSEGAHSEEADMSSTGSETGTAGGAL